MNPRFVRLLPLVAFVALVLAARPAAAQDWWPSTTRTPDTQYTMDENGNYTGEKRTIDSPLSTGNRYACRPTLGGYSCNPCGNCHTSAQVADNTYLLRFDARKHVTTHFPKLELKLGPTQKVAWGSRATLTMRGTEIIVQSLTTPPKDLVAFPAGSKLLRNQRGEVVYVGVPTTGEPRSLVR